jgi:hypothetical protein
MTFRFIRDPGPFDGRTLAFVNRARMHGHVVTEVADGFVLGEGASLAAEAAGLVLQDISGRVPGRSPPGTSVPRIAIYCGGAVGYPYWAYYAHAFLSLGLGCTGIGADEVISGKLADFDLLVMPGGFATWGLDRAEAKSGVDAAIHAFLADGGAYIGSCGGAFYLSSGRPEWLGIIDAVPRYTHEYLLTGAGLISVSLDDASDLGRGLPEAIEMPYYHGPVYAERPREAATLARFNDLMLPGRLFIDNPLDRALFDKSIRGSPAALLAAPHRGRAIVFSPHPEMGEFVRKGIVLDSYVRKYLPVRGSKVMNETLSFYAKDACAGFRMIHNAVQSLGLYDQPCHNACDLASTPPELRLSSVDAAIAASLAVMHDQAQAETSEFRGIAEQEFDRLSTEWTDIRNRAIAAFARASRKSAEILTTLQRLLNNAEETLACNSTISLVERLVLTELPVRLTAAACRIVDYDVALATPLNSASEKPASHVERTFGQ